MKLLCVASAGGHLAQLAELRRHWSDVDVHWVTFRKADAVARCQGEPTTWAYHPTTRNLLNAARNFRLAMRVMQEVQPDAVLSNGAGVAVPFFLAARRFRIPTVYLEVYDRVSMPTLTGRLCYPMSDAFLVQWPEQRAAYPRGKLVGRVY